MQVLEGTAELRSVMVVEQGSSVPYYSKLKMSGSEVWVTFFTTKRTKAGNTTRSAIAQRHDLIQGIEFILLSIFVSSNVWINRWNGFVFDVLFIHIIYGSDTHRQDCSEK